MHNVLESIVEVHLIISYISLTQQNIHVNHAGLNKDPDPLRKQRNTPEKIKICLIMERRQ